MRVLDVACGPGVLAAEIARSFPACEIVAVDASQQRAVVANSTLCPRTNARVCCGDAVDLPFDDATFDLVFCRFLLQYLPHPRRAVSEMARVVRPGGVPLLQDIDGQLLQHFPPVADLQRALRSALSEISATGFDPFVGRKLFGWMYGRGLSDIDVRLESYNVIAGRIDAVARRRWELKLDIARRAFERRGLCVRHVIDGLLAYFERPETLSFSLLFTVTGHRPL